MKVKKFIALLLAMVMMLGCFSGCASKPTTDAASAEQGSTASPEKKIRLGMVSVGDSTTASGRAKTVIQDTIAEAAGVDLVRVQLGGYDDESFITAYESMINEGVDAALVFTLSETVLPILKDMFEQSNVKFFLMNRKVASQEMHDLLFNSPMFIGNEHADETQNAYDMVKSLKETYDIKNMAVIGLTKGDINGDYRDAGIEKACQDLGINLLSETRGIVTTEDVTKAVEGFIASYPEMDSIFIVGGLITPGALAGANQALVNHHLQDKVKIAMVDISTGMEEYMDEGPLKLVAGGNLIADQIFGMVMAINALKGSPLSDNPVMTVNLFWINNGQDAADYDKYIEGEITPFSVEEYQNSMFKWMNPDVTLESVQKIATDFTIASVKGRNADKVS